MSVVFITHNTPSGPYLCLYLILSKYFKPLSAQEFGSEIHSWGITRKRTEQLSFLHWTLLLDLIYVPTIYYQIISNSLGIMACTRFWLQGDNYMKKKVRVVSFAPDTPTGPPLHPYQILSKYFKKQGSKLNAKILCRPEVDFAFSGHNYMINKVRVVSLTCDTPSVSYVCLYQISSKYFKPLRSYGVHKYLD